MKKIPHCELKNADRLTAAEMNRIHFGGDNSSPAASGRPRPGGADNGTRS